MTGASPDARRGEPARAPLRLAGGVPGGAPLRLAGGVLGGVPGRALGGVPLLLPLLLPLCAPLLLALSVLLSLPLPPRAAPRAAVARALPPWSRAARPSAGEAESVGGYARGCLYGARALPAEGVGFRSIRRARNRFYGHPLLIDVLTRIGARVAALGLRPVDVGDLSQPRGGLMSSGHNSHQVGLDADLWFGAEEAPPGLKRGALHHPSLIEGPREALREAAWSPRHLQLLAAAAGQPEVARLFVHWRVKEHLCALWERGALPMDPAGMGAQGGAQEGAEG
ncbi:MAG: hypothetical protein FJ138_03850, partial [Deltaproteobacteria bacterium]|nr:hypothetical protein [Deltaproteobacteria bacterium]